MAETTGLTKRQRRMWLRILVIVSLTLNLLFIGLVAGTFARVGPPMPPPPPSVGAAMFKAMPPDDRKEIRERMRGTRDMHRDERHASEAEAVLGRAHEAVHGTPLGTHVTQAYLDSRIYALFDEIPSLCYGPKGALSHGFDEYVEVASLERVTLSIALFIAEWCGLEPVEPSA